MNKLRSLLVVLLAAVLALTLAACKPSFEYDEDAAIDKAEEIIGLINDGDYQAVFEEMNAEMQSLLPAEALRDSFEPYLTEAGAFEKFTGMQTSGITQKGVDYIVVVASCKYENATRVYTISLTMDLEIGGLYMK